MIREPGEGDGGVRLTVNINWERKFKENTKRKGKKRTRKREKTKMSRKNK
jgi:hypothetical protein